jgi:hypothetical protein
MKIEIFALETQKKIPKKNQLRQKINNCQLKIGEMFALETQKNGGLADM